MIALFFVAELSALQLPHWLMIAGGVLVIVGTVGALVSSRRRAAAPPEPSRGEATELQEQDVFDRDNDTTELHDGLPETSRPTRVQGNNTGPRMSKPLDEPSRQTAKMNRERLAAPRPAILDEEAKRATAVRENMARLRELRLTKEAQEVQTKISTDSQITKTK